MARTLHHLLAGIGSVLCLFPQPYRSPFRPRPMLSDAEAMAADWRQVGDDLRDAMHQHAAERSDERPPSQGPTR